MQQVIEQFMERPRAQRVAFWIGSLLVIGYLFWQYSFKNQAKELEKISDKVESLKSEQFNQQRIARDLPKFEKAVKDLEVKLKLALQELPDSREIPNLLSSVSNLAKDAGLEVSLFKPKPENFKDFFAEVPVAITVDGNYHQVATFFDEVGRLPRIVNISDIQMKDAKVLKGSKQVGVKTFCTATTFRYLDEEEREKISKKAEANNGNGRRR
jgi:type IV pilus assembly protein PilO